MLLMLNSNKCRRELAELVFPFAPNGVSADFRLWSGSARTTRRKQSELLAKETETITGSYLSFLGAGAGGGVTYPYVIDIKK